MNSPELAREHLFLLNDSEAKAILLGRNFENHASFCRQARSISHALGVTGKALEGCRLMKMDGPSLTGKAGIRRFRRRYHQLEYTAGRRDN